MKKVSLAEFSYREQVSRIRRGDSNREYLSQIVAEYGVETVNLARLVILKEFEPAKERSLMRLGVLQNEWIKLILQEKIVVGLGDLIRDTIRGKYSSTDVKRLLGTTLRVYSKSYHYIEVQNDMDMFIYCVKEVVDTLNHYKRKNDAYYDKAAKCIVAAEKLGMWLDEINY